jgi:Family of unknown function (DUF5937)
VVMPIVIAGLDGPARPAPVVSALTEFGSALHVLRDPGHHGAAGWADRIRSAMSPQLAERTSAWWWTVQAIRSAPFVTVTPPGDDFGERLRELRAMPTRTLAGALLRPLSRSGDPGAALHWSRSRGPAVAAAVAMLVNRPGDAVGDFLGFLEESWLDWFCAEWDRIQPVLAKRAQQLADTIAVHGTARALCTLDPSVRLHPSGPGVSIAKVQNARHDVSSRGLLLAPSTFVWPHFYVPGRPLLLIHPAEPGPAMPAAAELLRRLDVVAHRGALEVARAIATEPRTAGEIAALWHIDPTLVTRYLRALAAAGLARTSRHGRFVQYQLDTATIETLGCDLVALLLR